MKKNGLSYAFVCIFLFSGTTFSGCSPDNNRTLTRQAHRAMQTAARYFRSEVSCNGGYLYKYTTDFTMMEGEEIATPTRGWLEPPGTPAVGMAYMEAYNATGDTLFLNCAIETAHGLAWGQLASGGWYEYVDFDPVESRKFHCRRDIEKGDTITGKRRNHSTLDDNKTQSALQLLMQVDKALDFKDADIHRSALYGLDALLGVQYPNGAWPQRFNAPTDPEKYPVLKARYPETWSRKYPGTPYGNFYTFNDNTIADVIKTMLEAYKTYGDERYLASAKKAGDFIILAQMPEPQPAWAQQYNFDMEPAWARRFEPPAISGGESFGVMRTLIELYLETGESRFLEPIPKAISWFERSLLPDNRIARFYELKTNRPLYFNAPRRASNLPEPAFPDLEDYTLIYEDTDLPNHYSFKGPGKERLEMIKALYNRAKEENARDIILAERNKIRKVEPEQVREIINSLDEKGRWKEQGRMQTGNPDNRYINAEIISTATFNRNISLLSSFILQNKK